MHLTHLLVTYDWVVIKAQRKQTKSDLYGNVSKTQISIGLLYNTFSKFFTEPSEVRFLEITVEVGKHAHQICHLEVKTA